MGRPKNPFGDPVSVTTKNDYLKVRYYPSGMITDPTDRKWLAGKWCKKTQRHLAEEAAALLREALLNRLAAHGEGPLSEVTGRGTVTLSVAAFVESLENDGEVPPGTAKARKTQLNVNLVTNWGSHHIEELGRLAPTIVGAVANATKRNGKPKAASTRSGALNALAVFGQWAKSTYHFYASHALAPVEAGGLGWSLSFVQECLGHQSIKTTETIYKHIFEAERRAARSVPHDFPGL